MLDHVVDRTMDFLENIPKDKRKKGTVLYVR